MHPVVRKLSVFADFTPEEESAIATAFSNIFIAEAKQTFAREDDVPTHLFFLLDGFVSRHKQLATGRRQILSFLIPGDPCDVGVTLLELRDHSLTAMVRSRLARISDERLDHLLTEHLKVRVAMQWSTLMEEAIAREWIANIGQRPAVARMAHLICEVYYRLRVVALTDGLTFNLPLSQADLGDAMGISSVHVNRTLQELRRSELLASEGRLVTILNLKGLEDVGEFDPAYLHLRARYNPSFGRERMLYPLAAS